MIPEIATETARNATVPAAGSKTTQIYPNSNNINKPTDTMKKFITATALLAASAALAGATTIDLADTVAAGASALLDRSDFGSTVDLNSTLGGYAYDSDSQSKSTSSVLATDVVTYLSQDTGFYWSTGTLNTTSSTVSSELSASNFGSVSSFTLVSRPAFMGEWAAAVINISDAYGTTYTDLSDLTISYTTTSSTSPALTLWVITDGVATQIETSSTLSNQVYTTETDEDGNESQVLVTADVTVSVSSIADVVTEDSTIVVLFSTSDGTSAVGGATVSGLSIVATVSEIPEPSAFGLLAGLGALAFIASRRRRTK